MGRITKGCTIVEARVEQILSFENLKYLKEYVQRRANDLVFYDINFSNVEMSFSCWQESFSEKAVKYIDGLPMLHISVPYNSKPLLKSGRLLKGRNE